MDDANSEPEQLLFRFFEIYPIAFLNLFGMVEVFVILSFLRVFSIVFSTKQAIC